MFLKNLQKSGFCLSGVQLISFPFYKGNNSIKIRPVTRYTRTNIRIKIEKKQLIFKQKVAS